MPTNYYYHIGLSPDERKARKRKHTEVVKLWRSGKLSWNEYCRLEKKYRD